MPTQLLGLGQEGVGLVDQERQARGLDGAGLAAAVMLLARIGRGTRAWITSVLVITFRTASRATYLVCHGYPEPRAQRRKIPPGVRYDLSRLVIAIRGVIRPAWAVSMHYPWERGGI